MPIKETKLSTGIVLIDRDDMTPSEEIEWFKRLNGVKSFPSRNRRPKILDNLSENDKTKADKK